MGLFLVVFHHVLAGEIILHGRYNGKNLYVQNPSIAEREYCIKEIIVNDQRIAHVPASTAFDIKMNHISLNTPVVVKIIHHDDCSPKVMNPGVIRETEGFKFEQLNFSNRQLHWVSKGESGYAKFFVLKFVHDNWTTEAVIPAKVSQDGRNEYHHEVFCNSGKNRYKIKYFDLSGNPIFSEEITFTTDYEKVLFYPLRVQDFLRFSKEVKYEIIDQGGVTRLKGMGSEVNCKKLPTGTYMLRYDNEIASFFKK
jgi:hypothetical protein